MLVLNATYEPINVCTVRRAVVLLLKEKAEMLERAEWELHSATSTMARPMVIRLVAYVRIPRDTHREPERRPRFKQDVVSAHTLCSVAISCPLQLAKTLRDCPALISVIPPWLARARYGVPPSRLRFGRCTRPHKCGTSNPCDHKQH